MHHIFTAIKKTAEYQELINLDQKGQKQIMVSGLSGTQKAVLLSLLLSDERYLMKHYQRPFLIISASRQGADRLYEELNTVLPEQRIGLLPALEDMAFEALGQSKELMGERGRLLLQLANGELSGIVASVDAILPMLMPAAQLRLLPLTLRLGTKLNLYEFLEKLVKLGFQRTHQVETAGYFAHRGSIVDIFPPSDSQPVRIDLFDEEIDSIRRFSSDTQLSLDSLREVVIYPTRELVLNSHQLQMGIEAIESDYESMKLVLTDAESRRNLDMRLKRLLDALANGDQPDELEHYLPYFIEKQESVLDYFTNQPLIICDEPLRIQETWENRLELLEEQLKQRLERGELLPRQMQRWYDFPAFIADLQKSSEGVLSLGILPRRPSWLRNIAAISAVNRSIPDYRGSIQSLMDDVERWQRHGYAILLLCDGPERGRRLEHTFAEYGLNVSLGFGEDRPPQNGEILIRKGALENCFEWPEARIVLLSDQLLFGRTKSKRSPGTLKEAKKLKSYRELVEGDFVVHINHGIGRYLGLVAMEVEGIRRDYLHLQYAGQDKIYIPIDQIGLIQKYLGSNTDSEPKLHALNSSEWQRSKQKVHKAIREMAIDLLKLYASRTSEPGFAFAPDDNMQAEFEELFPYEETEDQIQVIADVKRDMESSRPMERLLCGDVGYGKTEVAIRAAFKAVLSGKQVAVLAPTTVLVQQHFNTFRERLSRFPINIAMMSRFRSPKENRQTAELLRDHQVDIVIGTHRLLNKDISFADIGLLIIDEEQRFGVAQKEKLKQLRNNVDVLMLSATPIPRTLHMAMVGIRDMSLIETPPENRLPVQSYVVEWSDTLVREAILRELDRDGQVFFVHNRISDLDYFASHIAKLVPEARIVVGHGQMAEGRLEQVMLDFMEGEYNVLVSTTIIESGLDMPNVNTMIIHEADHFGLSQLHQLRGRVGRSNRRAYAYFTFRRGHSLSEIAEKRLAAIKEFCEFGAGLRIAQRDLELRGVGNLLGAEQHGNVAAIGFELYSQMLEEAVRELKNLPVPQKTETLMEINIEAFLPNSFVPDQSQKISVYKQIQSAATKADLEEIQEQLIDRFGILPLAVLNLLKVARLRIIAAEAGVVTVKQMGNSLNLTLITGLTYDLNQAALIVLQAKGKISHHAGKQTPFSIIGENLPELLTWLEIFLNEFKNIAHWPEISYNY